MIYASWSFDVFERWAHERAGVMREKGFLADYHVVPNKSVRLRIENGDNIGEIVIWNDGSVQQMVASLDSGDYLFESDGSRIGDARYDEFFRYFFSYF